MGVTVPLASMAPVGPFVPTSQLPVFDLRNTYGAKLDGVTDDTAAVQAAVAAAYAAGGGRIVGSGVCLLSSAATALANNGSGATNKACIHLDLGVFGAGTSVVPIMFEGPSIPHPTIGSITAGTLDTHGLVFYANPAEAQVGTGTQKAWVMSAGDGAGAVFQTVLLGFKFCTVRTPKGGSYGGVNAGFCYGVDADTLTVGVDALPVIALPANATVGFQSPYNNNGGFSYLGKLGAFGYVTNIVLDEHVNASQLWSGYCVNSYKINDCQHAIRVGRMLTEQAQHGIITANPNGSGSAPVSVAEWDIEDNIGTFAPVDHVSDAGNILSGEINFARVVQGVGRRYLQMTYVGAANVSMRAIGTGHGHAGGRGIAVPTIVTAAGSTALSVVGGGVSDSQMVVLLTTAAGLAADTACCTITYGSPWREAYPVLVPLNGATAAALPFVPAATVNNQSFQIALHSPPALATAMQFIVMVFGTG